jgi:hypothetical protein
MTPEQIRAAIAASPELTAPAWASADRWRPGLHGISPCVSFFNKG